MRSAILLVVLAGCGGAAAPESPDASPCSGGDDYAAGMERSGEAGATVRLLDAEPAPPARFVNTWTIEATGAAGAPATAADLTVTPFMPLHGHGAPSPPTVSDGADGTVVIDEINLWMPGLWEVRIDVAGDLVTFAFCIEG